MESSTKYTYAYKICVLAPKQMKPLSFHAPLDVTIAPQLIIIKIFYKLHYLRRIQENMFKFGKIGA